MGHRTSFVVLVLLLSSKCVGAADGTGSVFGKVVDPSGASLPFAEVQVSQESDPRKVYLGKGNANGSFYVPNVAPEIYSVRIAVQGFRTKVLAHVQVAAEKTADLGSVGLEGPDCDSPGVICDDFGLGAHKNTIHAQGVLDVPELCSVDVDEGQVVWAVELDGQGTIAPKADKDSDFWIQTEATGAVHLKPLDGVGFALNPSAEGGREGCVSAVYSTKDVRIDGLPVGSRVCIRTNRGRYAQLEFAEVVKQKAKHVTATYITWTGPFDSTALQNSPRR